MSNRQNVVNKVQQYLTEIFSNVQLGSDGVLSLRDGSARLFVRVNQPREDGPTFIHLTAPLLYGVNDSPALHEYIAFHADDYVFGHASLYREDDGSVNVVMTHRLLGDYLDRDELGYAVSWMLSTADDLDDELQTQFGGKRFHEE
ncbi:MAG: YbjN domain-containing protein [Aeromicrobium sp.]|uniref:T3SS (YopN, CesT) and YbjN peptide-binding chaperone 1 n=1 Tax=Aeromicrobium sp. TaxID=1871063 RepID=UPI0039E23E8D